MADEHKGQRIGYLRVSAADQNTHRQLDGVELDRTFEDKASGKDTNRPALREALGYVREGDVLICHSMDRLARSLVDLLSLVKDLTGRGVAVEFHKEKLTFTGEPNPMQELQLGVMGAVAQFERSMIKERQAEGIRAAQAQGKHLGRAPKLTADQEAQIDARAASGEDKSALAKEFGISRASVYNVIARQKKPAPVAAPKREEVPAQSVEHTTPSFVELESEGGKPKTRELLMPKLDKFQTEKCKIHLEPTVEFEDD
ncbi:MAG: recombinase family protein [Desulfovibrionaceae bacterium]|nr:recombinase family protein [Desulfovibrionaceae bacterium]MBF0515081.1 recombinase family protein [Desulfovibrionaceae bacterium]